MQLAFDSMECELFAILIRLVIADFDKRIKTLRTESQAVFAIIKKPINSNFNYVKENNWTMRQEIRRIHKENDVNVKWVKSHVGIRQN